MISLCSFYFYTTQILIMLLSPSREEARIAITRSPFLTRRLERALSKAYSKSASGESSSVALIGCTFQANYNWCIPFFSAVTAMIGHGGWKLESVLAVLPERVITIIALASRYSAALYAEAHTALITVGCIRL